MNFPIHSHRRQSPNVERGRSQSHHHLFYAFVTHCTQPATSRPSRHVDHLTGRNLGGDPDGASNSPPPVQFYHTESAQPPTPQDTPATTSPTPSLQAGTATDLTELIELVTGPYWAPLVIAIQDNAINVQIHMSLLQWNNCESAQRRAATISSGGTGQTVNFLIREGSVGAL